MRGCPQLREGSWFRLRAGCPRHGGTGILPAAICRFLLAWCLLGCALHAAEVTAVLSTDTVQAGEGALLSVRIDGGAPDEFPTIPEVEDLIVQSRGQSQQMRIVNGHVSRTISYDFVVGSQKEGEYEIPAIAVKVGGGDFHTEPLKLTVRPSAAGAPQGMDDNGKTPADHTQYGYLTFQMMKKERKHVYPGEIAPVRIQAFFPLETRVSLSGPPRPDGSAFTLHNLSDEPQQERRRIDGRPYLIVTWYGGLSATKAGSYPAGFSLDGTVAVRDRNTRHGDPMFDDFFAPMIQKQITLRTDAPPDIEVRELPAAGRPDDFTGAIGEFEFGPVKVPDSMATGEPARIEARITGRGNFALLGQPRLLPEDGWKTYGGRNEFVPGDAASFGGTKDFSFNAVPRAPGEKQARLGFSYFDPEAGEYRRVESAPHDISISGDATAAAEAEETPPAETPEEPRLAPLRGEAGPVARYEPLTGEPWFVPAVGGCGVLSMGILGIGLWRARRGDPAKSALRDARAAMTKALADADQAAARNDAPAFFAAAREGLRIAAAADIGVRPEAITMAELQGRVDEETLELWRAADRFEYSGEAPPAAELARLRGSLDRGVKSITGGHVAA